MKLIRYISLHFLVFSVHLTHGQKSTICAETVIQQMKYSGNSFGDENPNCVFEDNEYAFRKIEKLMSFTGFPMNFSVCKKGHFQNAYAVMDSSGHRFIIYDQAFLQKLDGDPSNIESATILAHEIGHHLAAHTVSINYENYRKTYSTYCVFTSPEYNTKRCQQEEQNYLEISRRQEIEADRFAGYIMQKCGASLEQISRVFYKIKTNFDDSHSTHPALDKRLQAVKAGFEIAVLKGHGDQRASLQEIKGSSLKLNINNTDRIARNKLIRKVIDASSDASSVIYNQYPYLYGRAIFLNGVGDSPGIVNYLGGRSAKQPIDTDNEYFEAYRFEHAAQEDPRIHFGALAGFHIQGNILKILVFYQDATHKVVYSCPFKEEKISLEEIKMIFVAIFTDAIEQSIKALH